MTHVVGARLLNFGRFRGEHELALGPGCYAVLAEHDGDPTRSNWGGKSTFGHALYWALEGKIPESLRRSGKRALDDLISADEEFRRTGSGVAEKEMAVEYELSNGWFLSRKKRRGESATLVLEPPEGSDRKALKGDEAQAELDRMVGLEQEERLSTIWAEQRDVARLLRATPGDLTKMVESWLGDSVRKLVYALGHASERVSRLAAEHAAALAEAERVSSLGRHVEVGEGFLEQAQKEYDAALRTYERSSAERASKRAWEEARDKRRSLRHEIDELKRELSAEVVPAFEPVVHVAVPSVEERLREVRAERAAAGPKLALLRSSARGGFDGACPVSPGFACPAKAEVNRRTSEASVALKEAEGFEQRQLEVERGLEAALAKERDAARARGVAAAEKARVEGRLQALRERLPKLEAALEALGPDSLEPNDRKDLYELEPPSQEGLIQAKNNLALARRAREDAPKLEKKSALLARQLRAALLAEGVVEDARRKVVEAPAAWIEDQANASLEGVGVPLAVRTLWSRATGVLETNCRRCGGPHPASARVKKCERCGALRGNKTTPEFRWALNDASGGAEDFGGLALRAAGFAWLREARGVDWSVAVLDEVSGHLDPSNRRAMSAGIRRLLAGTFEQAFVTAHERTALEACERRILIRASGSWSKIEVLA